MLNRRLTGGLAWAGLILILAVPSAEILTGGGDARIGAATATDPIETASVSKTQDAIDKLRLSGKPMPDYISDSTETAAVPVTPAPAKGVVLPTVPAAQPETVETAALAPAPVVAPVPMPASMRPTVPVVFETAEPAPLVLDEDEVLSREARIVPPAALPEPVVAPGPRYVTEDQLAAWDSGSLADYLERRGLISDAAYDNDSSAVFIDDDEDYVLSEGTLERRNRRAVEEGRFFIVPN